MRRCRGCLYPVSECICDDEDDEADPVTEIDRDALIAAVRESGIALKPGDVLAVRLPMSVNGRDLDYARKYARDVEAETGVKVAFIPGEEFAHASVTINVTMHGIDSAKLAEEVQRQLQAHVRRNGGGMLSAPEQARAARVGGLQP